MWWFNRFLLLRRSSSFYLLIFLFAIVNFLPSGRTQEYYFGERLQSYLPTAHNNYPAATIPLGYQPPPSGPLFNEYGINSYYRQRQNAVAAKQYPHINMFNFNNEPQQPNTLILNSNKQQPRWPSQQPISQQQQQQFNVNLSPEERYEMESTQQKNLPKIQQIEERPASDPLLINALIQVFAHNNNNDSLCKHLANNPKDEIITLVEGRTLTSINRPATNDELDTTALKGKHRIVLSKQLDTKARHFMPDSLKTDPNCLKQHSNPASSKQQKQQQEGSMVSVKAFAATNSSGISKAQLEAELNKELENSIPMIIDELDKAIAENKRQKDKSTTTTTPTTTTITTTIRIPNKADFENPDDEINSDDLNKLIGEALDEINATTMKPLIIFTKSTGKSLTTQISMESATTRTATVSRIPEAEDKENILKTTKTTTKEQTTQPILTKTTPEIVTEKPEINVITFETHNPIKNYLEEITTTTTEKSVPGVEVTEFGQQSMNEQITSKKEVFQTTEAIEVPQQQPKTEVTIKNEQQETTIEIVQQPTTEPSEFSQQQLETETITTKKEEFITETTTKITQQPTTERIEIPQPETETTIKHEPQQVTTEEVVQQASTIQQQPTMETSTTKNDDFISGIQTTKKISQQPTTQPIEIPEQKPETGATEINNEEKTVATENENVTETETQTKQKTEVTPVNEKIEPQQTTTTNVKIISVAETQQPKTMNTNEATVAENNPEMNTQTTIEPVIPKNEAGEQKSTKTAETTVEVPEKNVDNEETPSIPSNETTKVTILPLDMETTPNENQQNIITSEKTTTYEEFTSTTIIGGEKSDGGLFETDFHIESELTTVQAEIQTEISIKNILPNIVSTSKEITETCAKSTKNSDGLLGDVLFLLDSSESVGQKKFKRSIKLIQDIIKQFSKLGPNGIQISLVQFSEEPLLEFSFRRHNCLENALDDISKTQFNGTNENHLSRAIEKVMRFAFTTSRGDRPDVENVLVLITDGETDDGVQFPIELTKVNNTAASTTILVIAKLEANKEDIMFLAKEHIKNKNNTTDIDNDNDLDNLFDFEDLASNLPLAERIAKRIKQILRKTQGNLVLSEKTNDLFNEQSKDQLNTKIKKVEPGFMLSVDGKSSTEVSDSENNYDEDPKIDCRSDGIKATFLLANGFRGSILAKDHGDEAECVVDVEPTDYIKNAEHIAKKRPVKIEIQSEKCGLSFFKSENPVGVNQTIVLSVIHNKNLETGLDRSYIIQCFIPTQQLQLQNSDNKHVEIIETNLNIKPGIAFSKTISLASTPPKCHYSLRRDSPNGIVLETATVGQILYHRWECRGESKNQDVSSVYGIHVYDCLAMNRSKDFHNDITHSNNYQIVDSNGCSADPSLLGEIVYDEDQLIAYAKAFVFTLRDVDSLRFSCKIGLCLRDGDGCEGYSPPICKSSNISELLLVTRRAREHVLLDPAMENSLSSRLQSPQIDVFGSPAIAKIKSRDIFHQLNSRYKNITPQIILTLLIGSLAFGILSGLICYYLIGYPFCCCGKRRPNNLNDSFDVEESNYAKITVMPSLNKKTLEKTMPKNSLETNQTTLYGKNNANLPKTHQPSNNSNNTSFGATQNTNLPNKENANHQVYDTIYSNKAINNLSKTENCQNENLSIKEIKSPQFPQLVKNLDKIEENKSANGNSIKPIQNNLKIGNDDYLLFDSKNELKNFENRQQNRSNDNFYKNFDNLNNSTTPEMAIKIENLSKVDNFATTKSKNEQLLLENFKSIPNVPTNENGNKILANNPTTPEIATKIEDLPEIDNFATPKIKNEQLLPENFKKISNSSIPNIPTNENANKILANNPTTPEIATKIEDLPEVDNFAITQTKNGQFLPENFKKISNSSITTSNVPTTENANKILANEVILNKSEDKSIEMATVTTTTETTPIPINFKQENNFAATLPKNTNSTTINTATLPKQPFSTTQPTVMQTTDKTTNSSLTKAPNVAMAKMTTMNLATLPKQEAKIAYPTKLVENSLTKSKSKPIALDDKNITTTPPTPNNRSKLAKLDSIYMAKMAEISSATSNKPILATTTTTTKETQLIKPKIHSRFILPEYIPASSPKSPPSTIKSINNGTSNSPNTTNKKTAINSPTSTLTFSTSKSANSSSQIATTLNKPSINSPLNSLSNPTNSPQIATLTTSKTFNGPQTATLLSTSKANSTSKATSIPKATNSTLLTKTRTPSSPPLSRNLPSIIKNNDISKIASTRTNDGNSTASSTVISPRVSRHANNTANKTTSRSTSQPDYARILANDNKLRTATLETQKKGKYEIIQKPIWK